MTFSKDSRGNRVFRKFSRTAYISLLLSFLCWKVLNRRSIPDLVVSEPIRCLNSSADDNTQWKSNFDIGKTNVTERSLEFWTDGMELRIAPGTDPIILALQTTAARSLDSLSLGACDWAATPPGQSLSLTWRMYSATWLAEVIISTWSTIRLRWSNKTHSLGEMTRRSNIGHLLMRVTCLSYLHKRLWLSASE